MTRRRDWLKSGAALLASGGLPTTAVRAQAPGGAAAPVTPPPAPAAPSATPVPPAPPRPWSNWSGLQRCQPSQWLLPASEDELRSAIRTAPGPLRCVGAGHSFTPLVPTNGSLISLDRLSGVVAVDAQRRQARVRAGTRLGQLSRELHAQGLSLMNQPDIDVQTLAGALATGTHGTGRTLGALHEQVLGLRLVTPSGELLECNAQQNLQLFQAAKVSLGSLGVVTEVTLQLRARHMLHRRVWLEPVQQLLARADALSQQHRHFELYLLPFCGYAAGITLDEVPETQARREAAADEHVLADLKKLRDWLGRFPALRRWVAQRLIDPRQSETSVDWSHRLLSTVRPTRFNETEYHVPREQGLAALAATLERLERRNEVYFPMEFRWVKGDEAWLSPFHGRDSCSVAVHALASEPHDYLLSEIGPLLRSFGGRPHWGKLHDLGPAQLNTLYPRFADFMKLRQQLDPDRRLLSPAMAQTLLGPNRETAHA